MPKNIPAQEIYDLIFTTLRYIDIVTYALLNDPLHTSDTTVIAQDNNKYTLKVQINQESPIQYQFCLYDNIIKVIKEDKKQKHTYALIRQATVIEDPNIEYWVYENKLHIIKDKSKERSKQISIVGGKEYLPELIESSLQPYQQRNRFRRETKIHYLLIVKDNINVDRLVVQNNPQQKLTSTFPKVLKRIPETKQRRINEIGGKQ